MAIRLNSVILSAAALAGVLALAPLAAFAAGAAGAPAASSGAPDMNALVPVLTLALVLATVVEVALTTIFQWRWYLVMLDGAGWKTPITLAVCAVIVFSSQFDVVSRVMVALGQGQWQSSFLGELLTVFLIAGGQNTVYALFDKLGLRHEGDKLQTDGSDPSMASFRLKIGRSGNGGVLEVKVNGLTVGTVAPKADRFPSSWLDYELGYDLAPNVAATIAVAPSGTPPAGVTPPTASVTLTPAPGADLSLSLKL